MAQRGRPIPASDVRAIQRLRQVASVRATARDVQVSPTTVVKYTRQSGK